jgi:hypothetical protein
VSIIWQALKDATSGIIVIFGIKPKDFVTLRIGESHYFRSIFN